MTESPTRKIRIPLYVRVSTRGALGAATAYTYNVSEGGLYLKAPSTSAEAIALGDELEVSLTLPGTSEPLTVHTEIVWIDASVRDHLGGHALGMGLKFMPGQSDVCEQVRRFVADFRYRVIGIGLSEPSFAADALGDLYQLELVQSEEALRRAVVTGQVGLVLVGEGAAGPDDVARLSRIMRAVEQSERQPPILYCGSQSTSGLEALIARSGRVFFGQLPINPLELRTLVQRSVEIHVLSLENERLTAELERAFQRLTQEHETLRRRVGQSAGAAGIIGDSAPMRRLFEMVHQVSPLSSTVMILGETGTGKDLVARAIHELSPRAGGPFVAQNCAALPESLLDNELFGHVRGAFTGAMSDEGGLFEAADGGTLFLDEVGEMTPSMQAKLLRVLQDGEVRRIGSRDTTKVHVRVVCATHRDLADMVKEKRFREDLYYRLRGFTLRLPPLRERRTDIPALAVHFLQRYAHQHERVVPGITPAAMRLLEQYDWPGNVRELEHCIERLVVLSARGAPVGAPLVRESLGLPQITEEPAALEGRSLDDVLREYERRLIVEELERTGGVMTQAARALGVDRTTLTKRCQRLGIRTGSRITP